MIYIYIYIIGVPEIWKDLRTLNETSRRIPYLAVICKIYYYVIYTVRRHLRFIMNNLSDTYKHNF